MSYYDKFSFALIICISICNGNIHVFQYQVKTTKTIEYIFYFIVSFCVLLQRLDFQKILFEKWPSKTTIKIYKQRKDKKLNKHFIKYVLVAIAASVSTSAGTPRPLRCERILPGCKYRIASDTATTGNEDNDTPVQSQAERDKTVAANESSLERTSEGLRCPWSCYAVSRLMESQMSWGVGDK